MISNTVSLREICEEDAALLFNWRNDPEIVSLGTSSRKVEWEEHKNWVRNSFHNPDRCIYIILINGIPGGQIRFDRENEYSAVISIYLLSDFRFKGISAYVFYEGISLVLKRWHELNKIIAFIRSENNKSIKAFTNAGFNEERIEKTPENHVSMVFQVKKGKVPHNRLTFGEEEIDAVKSVVESGYWASGKGVVALEKHAAETSENNHAIAVSSGFSALRISLLALGVKKGDEVIIPGYCCVALANAVLAVGAVPVTADIDFKTLNLSADSVSKCITKNTKAIIAVHAFGLPAPIMLLKDLGMKVIEDCAHCFGINTEAGRIGSLGDIAINSFYATKLVGGGEGGMILTNSDEYATFASDFRDYTDKPPHAQRMNDKMSNLEAALSLEQLKRLPAMIRSRKTIAERYHEKLSNNPSAQFELPIFDQDRVWYRYGIKIKGGAERMISIMEKDGIGTDKPVFDWTGENHTIPFAKRAYSEVLSLPCYPTLQPQEQDRVIESFLQNI